MSVCSEKEDQVLPPFFLDKKPNGSNRFILNLKKLNKYILKQQFKLEDIRTAVHLIFPNYFLSSVDLDDAYYLIPIYKDSRKYLRFKFNNTLYEFVCLPFGLCTAPFVFTRVMKAVVKFLRNEGFSSVIYLDDFLCIESSFEKCRENVRETIKLLEWLGFLINYKKSKLLPSQRYLFLGFIIDTKKYAIELPEEKRNNIFSALEKFLNRNKCSIREFLGNYTRKN